MDKPVRVVIYEDELSLRNIFAEHFEYDAGFELLGVFPNCDHVSREMAELKPDVVLMDKEMPGKNGLTGLIEIKSNFPDIDVVMHTNMTDDETIFQCLQAGASGYIGKGISMLQVLEYLKIVSAGGTMFSPSIAGKVRDFFRNGVPQKKDEFKLTAKELEALGLLCDGLSQKLIAAEMNITVNGVAAHLRNVFRKLQVNSAPEAVAKSIRMRLLEPEKLRYR